MQYIRNISIPFVRNKPRLNNIGIYMNKKKKQLEEEEEEEEEEVITIFEFKIIQNLY